MSLEVQGLVPRDDELQLMIRALAVQALRSPGFRPASRAIAARFCGEKGAQLFDEFERLLRDVETISLEGLEAAHAVLAAMLETAQKLDDARGSQAQKVTIAAGEGVVRKLHEATDGLAVSIGIAKGEYRTR